MVTNTGDVPDMGDVSPSDHSRDLLCIELLGRGETIVTLRNGNEYELHGYDTHVYPKASSRSSGVVYTQNENNDEVWFFTDEIVDMRQH